MDDIGKVGYRRFCATSTQSGAPLARFNGGEAILSKNDVK